MWEIKYIDSPKFNILVIAVQLHQVEATHVLSLHPNGTTVRFLGFQIWATVS